MSRPLDTITDPAITIVFADSVGNSARREDDNRYASWLGCWGFGVDVVRHPESVNLMFVDGHGDMAPASGFSQMVPGKANPIPHIRGMLDGSPCR